MSVNPSEPTVRVRDLASHEEPFVRPEQLAEYFGVSRRHIRKLIQSGNLKAVRFGPRSLRVPKQEALDFERRVSSATGAVVAQPPTRSQDQRAGAFLGEECLVGPATEHRLPARMAADGTRRLRPTSTTKSFAT